MHSRLAARGAQLGLHVGHPHRGGCERGQALDQAADERGRRRRVRAAEALVAGARDAAVGELELDPDVVAAGRVAGLTGGGRPVERSGPLGAERVPYDGVGVHRLMVSKESRWILS